MVKVKLVLHYQKHEEITDEWLTVFIPHARVVNTDNIIAIIKEYLERPIDKREEELYEGEVLSVLDSRLDYLKTITGCAFETAEVSDTIINLGF